MSSPIIRLIKKLEAEQDQLDHEYRVELPKAIGTARDHGDLKENAEYHAAREKHAMVKARLGQIAAQVERLKLIDINKISRTKVGLYSSVTVFDINSEEEITYELVTGEEADPETGKISISSPIGKGLAGRGEGDETTIQIPSGSRSFEITALKTIHD